MRGPLEISVIGAGVAGLAIAATLAKAGHRVVVFERFATSLPLGSGLMLQPTGLAALERLGLRTKIETLGHRIDRLHGITDTNRTIFDLAYAGLDPRFHAVAVHRALLHGVLWDNFKTSGAELVTGQIVTGVESLADSKVRLTTATGTLPGTFDLVIDASGANSSFRPAVSSNTAREFTYGAVWASIPDLGISDACLSQRYVSARRMIGYLPVGRIAHDGPSLAALFWSLKPRDYPAWRTNFEPWRAEQRLARRHDAERCYRGQPRYSVRAQSLRENAPRPCPVLPDGQRADDAVFPVRFRRARNAARYDIRPDEIHSLSAPRNASHTRRTQNRTVHTRNAGAACGRCGHRRARH